MLTAEYIESRISCTEEEMLSAWAFAERLVDLYVRVRRDGLLTINTEDSTEDELINSTIELLCCAKGETETVKTLEKNIVSSDKTGQRFIEMLLALEFVKGFFSNENPQKMLLRFYNHFGKDVYLFYQKKDKEFRSVSKKTQTH